MAYEEGLRSITLKADSSIGIYTGMPGTPGSTDPNYGKQYCFVKVTGEQTAGLAVAEEGPAIGVLQNKPQGVGHAATVGIRGVSLVMAGDMVTAGQQVSPQESTGRAVTLVGGKLAVGTALTSGADGELISVLLSF